MNRNQAARTAIGGSWEKLSPPLTPWIMDVIRSQSFTSMSPVQAGTIPRAVKNQDCVVEAVTGSGKTLAFVLPILERLCRSEKVYKKGEVAAIVIAPTRELASQIHDVFHLFLSSLIPPPAPSPVASSSRSPSPPPPMGEAPYSLPCLITSGTPTPYETFLSLSSNILIGTPGRLAAFLLSPRGQSVVRVSDLDCLVLDEADRLLSSPDHRRDVERIMRHLPKQRRTHLFSATMTDAVEEMIGLGLRNPVRIVVNLKDKRTGEEAKERRMPTRRVRLSAWGYRADTFSLENTYLVCRHAEKTLQLVRLLQAESVKHEAAKFIVYFSTCAAVDYFYRLLSGVPALSAFHLTSLHGDLPPRVRETALSSYTSHASSHLHPAVLLCTDVAARGVDFADVDVVIQYDPPTDPKTFSHRAGRTARAGRRGKSVVLLARGREEEYVDFLSARKMPVRRIQYLGADLNGAELPDLVESGALSLRDETRRRVLKDRDLHDRAVKAFVSGLRAYSKHEASFIFRIADLDFQDLATAYGLLRLPSMPEVKDWRKRREAARKSVEKRREAGEVVEDEVDFPWEDADVDWDTFAYASKPREAARLEALAAKRSTLGQTGDAQKKRKIRAEIREAWSEQKDKKAKKEERKDKREKHKDALWKKQLEETGGKEVGMVEKFIKKERAVDAAERQEEDREYKAMKREVKGERGSGKGKAAASGGMFDGLD